MFFQKATGIDLTMPKKKGKKRKKTKKVVNVTNKKMKTSAAAIKEITERKFPGLTSTDSRRSKTYRRLAKKIFNR